VKEYRLIDYERKKAEFYQLRPDGTYEMALPDDGIYHSKVLTGFRLKVEWLWRDPQPRLQEVLQAWGLT